MNRKIEVGSVLSETFSLYGSQAGVLLPMAFLFYLAVAILDGLAGSSLVLVLVASIVGIAAGTLYQGTVVNLVRDVQDGRRDFSAGELLSSATPFILPLIGAGILAGLGIGIGFVLLIVPGLILLTIWSVIAPVIVVEKSGVMDSFGRSRALVRGNGWPVFGAIFVTFLIVIVAGILFVAIAEGISDGPFARIVFSLLASTLTAPIGALVASVLYFRLRAIEGAPAASAVVEEPGDGLGQPPAAAG